MLSLIMAGYQNTFGELVEIHAQAASSQFVWVFALED
jgi:hypothetical protein